MGGFSRQDLFEYMGTPVYGVVTGGVREFPCPEPELLDRLVDEIHFPPIVRAPVASASASSRVRSGAYTASSTTMSAWRASGATGQCDGALLLGASHQPSTRNGRPKAGS